MGAIQHNHPNICRDLDLPIPNKGQVVAVRIVKDDTGTLLLDGYKWRIATPEDKNVSAPNNY